jgi:integrase
MTGLGNPVRQIRIPKAPPGRDRRLNPGELDRIISASGSSVLPDITRFAVETGMRQAEIAGMTWELVDLKKRTVTLLDTKNGERRIVPLSTEAIRILSGLVRRIDGEVWGIQPRTIAISFARAVSRARAAYEKECEEKKRRRIRLFWPIFISTTSGTRPPAGSSRRGSTRWRFPPSRATRRSKRTVHVRREKSHR